MTRHLVLGGGGFIGSHLCKRLAAAGNEVFAVDVEFPAFREPQYPRGVQKWYGDLRDIARVSAVLHASEPDVVWQLAADMGGVEYFHSSHDWQAAVNNQLINVNVMDAVAHRCPNARVVFTSTACALATEKQTHDFHRMPSLIFDLFGDCQSSDKWELTEEDITWGTPDQLYGQEKRNSAFLWSKAPIDTRVAFLHTVYGPFQEHSGIRMKFPSAVAMKARRARESGRIELLGDGRQVRTYLYVDDAVDRLVALGASDEDPGFVNIGGTKPYTVQEVACIAAQIACRRLVPTDGTSLDKRPVLLDYIDGPTGVEARAADMTKFNSVFPQFLCSMGDSGGIIPLEMGMRRFIDWLDEIEAV